MRTNTEFEFLSYGRELHEFKIGDKVDFKDGTPFTIDFEEEIPEIRAAAEKGNIKALYPVESAIKLIEGDFK